MRDVVRLVVFYLGLVCHGLCLCCCQRPVVELSADVPGDGADWVSAGEVGAVLCKGRGGAT